MKDGKPPRSIKLILNLGKGLAERPKIQILSKLIQPPLQTSHLSKPLFKANDNRFSLLQGPEENEAHEASIDGS